MSTSRPAIIAKIRKCLALSRSANEHEAAAALARAQQMMAEHGISDLDVELAEVTEGQARGSCAQTPARWESLLAKTVDSAFGITHFIGAYGEWRFVGFDPAPEIAAYAFATLYRQLKRSRVDYISTKLRRCKLATKRRRGDDFCLGWVSAVYSKIQALKPSEVAAEKVGRYLAHAHPDLRSITPRSHSKPLSDRDYWNGHDEGRSVDLNRGVRGTAPALLA